MRTEEEMFRLILDTARADERIRAVYMNGSRTNPNAPKDIFQDYDIVYVVTDTAPFIADRAWIDRFGERLYAQLPEETGVYFGCPVDFSESYGWLMQFRDGNRLDLHVQSIPFSCKEIVKDRLCRILLDKDNLLPEMPPATDADYYVSKPTEPLFLAVCNEFWWCLNNVAKGLWRGEIPYVQENLNGIIRPQLIRLLSWEAGLLTHFTCSPGKGGKYLYRWLPEQEWQQLLQTYAGAGVPEIWEAVFCMCHLFDQVAVSLAEAFHFSYNREEAANSMAFLRHVYGLPHDAKAVY